MTRPRVVAAAAIAALSFAAGAGTMWASGLRQQSTRVPQFENEQLKAWKSIVVPNAPMALHRHDHGRALIALSDGVLDIVDQHGKTLNSYTLKRGTAMWLGVDPPGQMHADVNPGKKPLEVIVVQLQQDTVKK